MIGNFPYIAQNSQSQTSIESPQFIANVTFTATDFLVTILKNTLGFSPVFIIKSESQIELSSNYKFIANRTALNINKPSALTTFKRNTTSSLLLDSPANSLVETTIEISVLPEQFDSEFSLFSDEFSDEFE